MHVVQMPTVSVIKSASELKTVLKLRQSSQNQNLYPNQN